MIRLEQVAVIACDTAAEYDEALATIEARYAEFVGESAYATDETAKTITFTRTIEDYSV